MDNEERQPQEETTTTPPETPLAGWSWTRFAAAATPPVTPEDSIRQRYRELHDDFPGIGNVVSMDEFEAAMRETPAPAGVHDRCAGRWVALKIISDKNL